MLYFPLLKYVASIQCKFIFADFFYSMLASTRLPILMPDLVRDDGNMHKNESTLSELSIFYICRIPVN